MMRNDEITGEIVSFQRETADKPLLPRKPDLSDVPSQGGRSGWTRPGLLGGPVGELRLEAARESVLVLDSDVREYFGPDGESRSRKMNAVLREYAEEERKRA